MPKARYCGGHSDFYHQLQNFNSSFEVKKKRQVNLKKKKKVNKPKITYQGGLQVPFSLAKITEVSS